MIPTELVKAAEDTLRDCPHDFSFDLVWVPSSKMSMSENPSKEDTSWLGLVIYEDDINRYAEPERVTIGYYLYSARHLVRKAGYKCEFYPLPGRKEDHAFERGTEL